MKVFTEKNLSDKSKLIWFIIILLFEIANLVLGEI